MNQKPAQPWKPSKRCHYCDKAVPLGTKHFCPEGENIKRQKQEEELASSLGSSRNARRLMRKESRRGR